MQRFSFFLKLCGALVFAALCLTQTAHAQNDAPFAFTILGPDGVVARVITTDAQCPQITVDGNTSAMNVRAAPDADFPVMICDTLLPKATASASVNGQPLKLPPAKPGRVLVLGDTGCRLKGTAIQACNDTTQWPFAPLADSAAQTNPDLIIHVGDYHYRESECPADNAGCAGSPFGDNWAAWDADFFTPARNLLAVAPWVITPGNHEDCARAGIGYFRLLDPRALPASCLQYTEPYALDYIEPQIIVLDDSAVNDFAIEPDQLAVFQKQFQEINALAANTPTWIAMHDPMYVFGHIGEKDGKEQTFIDQLTLQQASNNMFPNTVQMFIGGHVHLFQVLSFDGTRPPQLVVGNSGTRLDKPVTTPLTEMEIAGMKPAYGTNAAQFGFVLLERAGDKWTLAVKNVAGSNFDNCVLGGGTLLCGQAALPQTGADFGNQNQWWLTLVLIGGAMLLIGLALAVRGMRRA